MATQQQVNDFIAQVLPAAQVESKRTGIPVSVMITQAGYETGWGTSEWWRVHRNPAGIGVTGQPGKGFTFPDVASGWRAYADKLLGKGEYGQGQFVSDVNARAGSVKLLQDLEQSPWAAGHYSGHGLESTYAAMGLGKYDLPGAKPPPGGNPIPPGGGGSSGAPGTPVQPVSLGGDAAAALNAVPGLGGLGSLFSALGSSNPLDSATKAFEKGVGNVAARTGLVIFGAIAVLIGLAIMFRDAGDDVHSDLGGGGESAPATAPTVGTAPPPPSSSPAVSRSRSGAPVGFHGQRTSGPGRRAPGESGAGKSVSTDVKSTAEGAAEAV